MMLTLLATTVLARALPGAPCLLAELAPDGRTVAVVPKAAPRTVELRDTATGRVLRTLRGPAGVVHALSFTPDGRWLAASANDFSVRVWRVADGHTRWVLADRGESPVKALAFSPDGHTLATGSWDYTLYIRAADSGRKVMARTQRDRINFGIGHLAWRADGRMLIGVGDDEFISRWRMPGLSHRVDVDGFPQSEFVTDGRLLAFRNSGGVRALDLATGHYTTFKPSIEDAHAIGIFPGAGSLLLGRRWSGSTWLRLDLKTGAVTFFNEFATSGGEPVGFLRHPRVLLVRTLAGQLVQYAYE